jgi:hypothetical protein
MTEVGTAMEARKETGGASFVEWSPVLAGAVLAAALSFVLLTFGTAIGLSAASPWPNSGLPAKVIASLAVFWVMAQQIGSVMAGGYVAGRMRSCCYEAVHESEFRDGLHGGLVWAVAVLIGAVLVFATAGVVTRTGADVASKAVVSLPNSDSVETVLDTMTRPASSAPGAAAAPSAAARPRTANAPSGDEMRAEMGRILASAVASGLH